MKNDNEETQVWDKDTRFHVVDFWTHWNKEHHRNPKESAYCTSIRDNNVGKACHDLHMKQVIY